MVGVIFAIRYLGLPTLPYLAASIAAGVLAYGGLYVLLGGRDVFVLLRGFMRKDTGSGCETEGKIDN